MLLRMKWKRGSWVDMKDGCYGASKCVCVCVYTEEEIEKMYSPANNVYLSPSTNTPRLELLNIAISFFLHFSSAIIITKPKQVGRRNEIRRR
ncbi:hypothetical protein HanRHA438_Chr06g0285891 [Helianthus annuus]|nr:hypothetical protein HanRHA438_Chr06g0285891 [Helianthus annuus]